MHNDDRSRSPLDVASRGLNEARAAVFFFDPKGAPIFFSCTEHKRVTWRYLNRAWSFPRKCGCRQASILRKLKFAFQFFIRSVGSWFRAAASVPGRAATNRKPASEPPARRRRGTVCRALSAGTAPQLRAAQPPMQAARPMQAAQQQLSRCRQQLCVQLSLKDWSAP